MLPRNTAGNRVKLQRFPTTFHVKQTQRTVYVSSIENSGAEWFKEKFCAASGWFEKNMKIPLWWTCMYSKNEKKQNDRNASLEFQGI